MRYFSIQFQTNIYVTNDLSNSNYILNGKKQTTINVRHIGLQLCVTVVNLPLYNP